LVVCAGGILAADDGWISTLRLDFVKAGYWFSGAGGDATADFSAPVETSAEIAPRARLAMGGLLHGLLFERPTGRWALDSRRPETYSSLGRRLGEFEQINQVSGADNFFAHQMAASFASIATTPHRAPAPAVTELASPTAITATGIWSSNGSGSWSSPVNWLGGVVADGAGNQANFSTLNITTDVTVFVDTPRTIGQVVLGDLDGSHHYTLAPSTGGTLIFDSGIAFTPAILQQSLGSAGDTVSVPMVLNSSLDVNNFEAANQLHLSGNIAAGGNVNSNQTLWFNRVSGATGNIRVSGNITDGGTGGQIDVVVGGGTVVFEGTNTYNGSTSVDAGTLLINGDNSGATATVFVSSGGTLGGTGTIGGDVWTFGGTITGDTSTTVGALTLLGDVHLFNNEIDGIYLANLSGSTSDLLAITGTMFLGGGSELHIVGAADGITTYTLATFGAHDGVFNPMLVTGIPMNYELVYHDTDLQLVPIPEPATWVGGGLALAAMFFASRKRFARRSRVIV
jgi:autotransporter-associated beta strand protein